MAVRVTQQRDQGVMTDNVKLISMILLSVSLFFFILFFTAYSIIFSSTELGISVSGNEIDDTDLFIYSVIISALTVAVVCMEFYHIRHRALGMFKYAVIVANAVFVGLTIQQLSKGTTDLFETDSGALRPLYTYSALATGFAGIGTLLAIIHNFHGIMGLV